VAAEVALLAREHAAIAATSARGRQQVVPDSTHLIQMDQPDAVVAAVAAVAR
jgi:pimeloyl-ACP methyl ester carboxylesterase